MISEDKYLELRQAANEIARQGAKERAASTRLTEAKIRLNAAAPELLAALKVLLPYLPSDVMAVDPQQHAGLIMARAAIAKAEGK